MAAAAALVSCGATATNAATIVASATKPEVSDGNLRGGSMHMQHFLLGVETNKDQNKIKATT